jgi:hypothetical protein
MVSYIYVDPVDPAGFVTDGAPIFRNGLMKNWLHGETEPGSCGVKLEYLSQPGSGVRI